MRVVVAGSSGLIGTALVAHLRAGGHEVLRLVRRQPAGPDERGWDPPAGRIDAGTFDGVDAVVNLNGVGVADRPWSGARRQAIRDSRNVPTDVLARAVAEHGVPTLLSQSATGYYGDGGRVAAGRVGTLGTGFLADVLREWEAAAQPPATRVRGSSSADRPVLSPSGGLLGPLKLGLRFAVGARLGPRHAVHAVDLARRRGRRDPVPAGERLRRRSGERRRADARHERRVHGRARQSPASPGAHSPCPPP